ncbi:MAG: hypothetical protein JNJ78_18425, partial [Anaerolineae bacterium]|nr:hypothetical protein [Anaerolineae bacterium]
TTGIAAANAVLQTHQLEPYPVLQPPPPERLVRVLEALTRAVRHTIGRGLLTLGRLLRRKRV